MIDTGQRKPGVHLRLTTFYGFSPAPRIQIIGDTIMLKKLGLSAAALIFGGLLLAPAPAKAGQIGFGITFGNQYPYTYADPYGYNAYPYYSDPYYYGTPAYGPGYVTPYYYHWGDRDRHEFREHEHHERREHFEHGRGGEHHRH
jgi:hypothetical protein